MHTANHELCKTLYEASGHTWLTEGHRPEYAAAPAYDLGFLLRRLPGYLRLEYRFAGATNTRAWVFYHSEKLEIVADTPENAACSLAIALFEQGVLTKGGQE